MSTLKRPNPGTIIFQDTLSNRPSAGVAKRFFFATDTKDLYYDTGSAWTVVATAGEAIQTSNDPSGFILDDGVPVDDAGTSLVLSVVDGTRTLSLTPTGSTFTVFTGGIAQQKTGAQSVSWTDTEGLHHFYYDTDGTLKATTTFSNSFILGPKAYVASLYWDAANNVSILGGQAELHGHQMDGATHLKLHTDFGASWRSGLSLSDIVADGNGTSDTHAQFGVASGQIADEDLVFDTPTIGPTAGLPILYLSGAGANLREADGGDFSVLTDTAASVGTTGRIVYNEYTGGAWQLTTLGNNDYMILHVFAVGSISSTKRVYAVLGQGDYATKPLAEASVETELISLLNVLPLAELKPLASLIFNASNSDSNAVKATIISTASGDDYYDWRTSGFSNGVGASPLDHSLLTGRDSTGAHPAAAVSVDAAAFAGNLTTSDTNVQLALATIDGLILGSVGNFCSVGRATTQSITTGTDTKVEFTTENSDVDGIWDSATNFRATPNIAGIYACYSKVRILDNTDGVIFQVAVRKNGSAVSRGPVVAATGATSATDADVFDFVSMNGTSDYLEIWIKYEGVAGPVNTDADLANVMARFAYIGPNP